MSKINKTSNRTLRNKETPTVEKSISKAKLIKLLSKEVNRKATERMFKDLILGK